MNYHVQDCCHIVFICDENYVLPTAVAISSIYANKKSTTKYTVHILADQISAVSLQYFTGLSREDLKINVINQVQTPQMQRSKKEYLHVSTAALYKFYIADIFEDLDRILYLDSDLLIRRDLSELFDTDLTDAYAAVVKDYKPMTYTPPHTEYLHISHSAYFNSGVMLLNLRKMREDSIRDKLIEYRKNGINFFMDQDALNVVFQEKVRYLPFYYNVTSSVMGHFDTNAICRYYDLDMSETKAQIYDRAYIVHLCTKYKPWKYSNVPFADEWFQYYRQANIPGLPEREEITEEERKLAFANFESYLTLEKLKKTQELIISLTSFPGRVPYLPQVLQSLVRQTLKADRILLWLADSQFPNREADLPEEVLRFRDSGVEICWCDDLRPHKKYFYTMQQYPDSIVITVDDDVCYADNLTQRLLQSYYRFPYAVSAMRAHQIRFDENGVMKPYAKWRREIPDINYPSHALVATGVSGVLYPPHCLPQETFNKEMILRLCLNADDLWLKTMELINNVPVVLVDIAGKAENILGSQDTALWRTNDAQGENDIYFENILNHYNLVHGPSDTLHDRMRISSAAFESAKDLGAGYLEQALRIARQEVEELQASRSYRIGRMITFIPRKIRGGIICCQENGFFYTVKYCAAKLLGKA